MFQMVGNLKQKASGAVCGNWSWVFLYFYKEFLGLPAEFVYLEVKKKGRVKYK